MAAAQHAFNFPSYLSGKSAQETISQSGMNKTTLFLLMLLIFVLPLPAYFQQQVNYHIRVELFPDENRLSGTEQLHYFNNSPDSLDFLYFHLYMNKFRRPSGECGTGCIKIISVRDSIGHSFNYQIDGTIMKLPLFEKLAPGDSLALHFEFETFLPEAGERFGYYGNHFDVGNWYPVPAVYDRFGWHPGQHIDGEFYQEWGNYFVEISVPKGFVVGATGQLLNPQVMPDSVRFPERKISYDFWQDSSVTTYSFRAERVHDFAWTADPEYVLKTRMADSVELRFLLPAYRIEDWQKQMDVAVQAFSFFQEKIGPYPYPQLTIADGYVRAGGIEYPSLVIISDWIYEERYLSETIVHEIAHQWYYGLLGNNQTRYGWMDEGFATFFENLGMQAANQQPEVYIHSPAGFWGRWFGYWRDYSRQYRLAYLNYVREDKQEPLNLNFDWFQGDPFTPYYDKMSLVVEQLHFLLGDSLFWEGISAYYRNWRFRHPYPADLVQAFEQVSGRQLDWFFDEWLNTTWTCDYAVEGFEGKWRSGDAGKQYHAVIRFRRKKPIVMPLPYRIYLADGSYRDFRIPVADGSSFQPAERDIAWPFYNEISRVYLQLPHKITGVQLDPENRLADMNPFNNRAGLLPPVRWYWLHRQYLQPHTDAYTATLFPLVFYNTVDGLQPGIRTRGNYLYPDYQHQLQLLFGIKSLRPEIDFWFEHPFYGLNRDVHHVFHAFQMAGRRGLGYWLQWKKQMLHRNLTLTAGWQLNRQFDTAYQLYPFSTAPLSYLENVINWSNWKKGFLPEGWEINLHTESSFLGSSYSYSRWELNTSARVKGPRNRRLTAEASGGGLYGSWPIQKAFRAGGGSFDEFLFNPFLRSKGTLPQAWWQNGHVFLPGGGGLRSLSGEWQDLSPYYISGGLSLDLGNPLNPARIYLPFLSDILFSGYTRWAILSQRFADFKKPLGEDGISIAFTRLPFLLNYFDVEQIRIDLPLWVNRRISRQQWDFRWTIQLEIRSFY
ncbi:MAG: M1 family metallopeptidase [Calditrichia bacterium]